MSIDDLKARLDAVGHDAAKDLKLNLSSVLTSSSLTTRQLWGAAVAAALAVRNSDVAAAIAAAARPQLTPEEFRAAETAAALMAMNNVYYRSIHLLGGDYGKMPARLRMTALAKPGVDKADFELWSLAVSAVNGCGMCLKAHEHEVLGKGLSKEAVQDALRIAATIHGVAATLEGADALATAERSAAAA